VILHMLGASTVYSDPGCGRLNDLQELSKTHGSVQNLSHFCLVARSG